MEIDPKLIELVKDIGETWEDALRQEFTVSICDWLMDEGEIEYDYISESFRIFIEHIATGIIDDEIFSGHEKMLKDLPVNLKAFYDGLEGYRERCAHPRWACEIIDSLGDIVGWVKCKRCGASWYENMEAEL